MKDRYQGWVQAAPEFSFMIEDFDDLVDPRHLYDCCLGPEPSEHVLKKILWKEKNMHGLSSLLFILFFIFKKLILLPDLLFAKMATRYSKDKYALVKGLKNEPLSQLTFDSKKCKLSEGKGETTTPSSIFGTLSSPTCSLEMITFSPPTTHSMGKCKAGKSIWEDPTIALGRAHNVITDDELRGLSFILSHELVSHHVHKLVQVFWSITFIAIKIFTPVKKSDFVFVLRFLENPCV